LLFGLLFRAAAETLLELAADPRHLGARIGLLMVLHTWGQLMNPHAHVHMVVPGGGLSLDGTRWVSCRDGFFLPVEVIGSLFRGKFLAGVKRLWQEGKLKLEGKLSPLAEKRRFELWLSTLYKKKWVVYAQGPPSGVQGAEAVLKYLARYVSGVAISDKRLVSHVDGRVAFRWKNYGVLKKGTGRGGREGTTSLAGVEFVERYMQHVLPRGLVRVRDGRSAYAPYHRRVPGSAAYRTQHQAKRRSTPPRHIMKPKHRATPPRRRVDASYDDRAAPGSRADQPSPNTTGTTRMTRPAASSLRRVPGACFGSRQRLACPIRALKFD